MSWKVWHDLGEWSVYEAADEWGGFATEAEAIDELRRLQTNELVAAEKGLRISKKRVANKWRALTEPPKVRRMKCRASDSPLPTSNKP